MKNMNILWGFVATIVCAFAITANAADPVAVKPDCKKSSWFYDNCVNKYKARNPGYFGQGILAPGTPLIKIRGASGSSKKQILRAIARQNGFEDASELNQHFVLNASDEFLSGLDLTDEQRATISSASASEIADIAADAGIDPGQVIAASGASVGDILDSIDLGSNFILVNVSDEVAAQVDAAVQKAVSASNEITEAIDDAVLDAHYNSGGAPEACAVVADGQCHTEESNPYGN